MSLVGPIGIDRFSRPFCHRWPVRAVERYTGPWNKTLSNPILVIGVYFYQITFRVLEPKTESDYD
jgi:hypothetical protein